jgi:hypothetical protein
MARVFTVFREADGPFAVAEREVYELTMRTTAIMSRRLGSVGMTGVRSVHIPSPADPYDVAQERLPDGGMYNVIFSRRLYPGDGIHTSNRHGTTYLAYDAGKIIGSQTMVSVAPPQEALLDVSLAHTVHQLTHTFGVRHCADTACIMQIPEIVDDGRWIDIIHAGDPYCLDHHVELEYIAARMAAETYE